MQIALTALSSLLPQLPVICVMAVGIAIAIARWQKHPRVSALLVVALSLEIASAVIYPLLTAILISSGTSATQMGGVFGAMSLGAGALRAVLLALTLWAAFGWRTAPHER